MCRRRSRPACVGRGDTSDHTIVTAAATDDFQALIDYFAADEPIRRAG